MKSGFYGESALPLPKKPISAIYNSLKINKRFGNFLAEKSYRKGLNGTIFVLR